ncbi:unnamed protein product [Rotaria socialis]|uniref:Uncharacterized protein n=1 Tax=Rotaria socialis TaxID=392032 RepID=A0A820G1U4_9BILA|nr:unnamed protein product [Rotaria socialis]CAF3574627.1 unnamed protein product [Rotaria socialis]CAF4273232.1 unnamed protein product [Rotaria socialis]CAF4576805.1 unnamed protein product [Rotaria socialis]
MHAASFEAGTSILRNKYDKEQRIKVQQYDKNSYLSGSAYNGSVWQSTKIVPISEVQLRRTIYDSNSSQKQERKTEVNRRAGVYAFCCDNYKILLVGLIIGILTAGIVLGTIIALWLGSTGEIDQ